MFMTIGMNAFCIVYHTNFFFPTNKGQNLPKWPQFPKTNQTKNSEKTKPNNQLKIPRPNKNPINQKTPQKTKPQKQGQKTCSVIISMVSKVFLSHLVSPKSNKE